MKSILLLTLAFTLVATLGARQLPEQPFRLECRFHSTPLSYLDDCGIRWLLPEATFDNWRFSFQRRFDHFHPKSLIGQLNFRLNNSGWGELIHLDFDFRSSPLSGISRPYQAEISFFIIPLGKARVGGS